MIFDLTKRKGGGSTKNLGDYATNIRFYNSSLEDNNPVLVLPKCQMGDQMFYKDQNTWAYETIDVTFGKPVKSMIGFADCYTGDTNTLTSITIRGDFSSCSRYDGMVKNADNLTGIYGDPLNFKSVTNTNFAAWAKSSQGHIFPRLTYVRYVPNTLGVDQNINVLSGLDADSLISIANGLKAVAKTITLHATPKALLTTITGTVTTASGGYDVFTKDSQGIITLEHFITQTKGWTIA